MTNLGWCLALGGGVSFGSFSLGRGLRSGCALGTAGFLWGSILGGFLGCGCLLRCGGLGGLLLLERR